MLRAAGGVLARYLEMVASTAKISVALKNGPAATDSRAVRPDELTDLAFATTSAFYPFWNAHSLILLTAFLSESPLRVFHGRFQAVADDSPGGLVTRALFKKLSIACRPLSFTSPDRRLEDLRSILSERPPLFMAADSHGPYRSVSIGMARLASAYELVCPVSVASSRAIPLFRELRMGFPLPGARIHVSIGLPCRLSRCDGLKHNRAVLEAALMDLERSALQGQFEGVRAHV